MTQLPKYQIAILILSALSILNSCSKEEQEISEPNVPPNFFMNSPVNTTSTSISLTIAVQHYGSKTVKEFGFAWSETKTPTIEGNKFIYTGSDQPGKFTGTVTNLKPNTIYYFRGYIMAEDNTITYSSEVFLKTLLHQIISITPTSASADTEVTVNGSNFEPGVTTLYVNDEKINATITNSTVKFTVPFGWDIDSVSIAVEMGGVRLLAPKKLQYKKGRWVQLKALGDNTLTIGYPVGLTVSGQGYIHGWGNKTIFEYSVASDSWAAITDFTEATSTISWFSVGRGIFAQTGYEKLFKYDLDLKQWSTKPPLPISKWYPGYSIAFTVKNTGYMGLSIKQDDSGKSIPNNEMWKFQSSETWVRLADFPGKGVVAPLALTIDETVYVIGGGLESKSNGETSSDTWKYNTTNDSWEKKAAYPGKGRVNMTGFVMNDKLYVGSGLSVFRSVPLGADASNDFWEYDPATNKWTAIADFVELRYHMYSFAIQNKGYVGGGQLFYCSGCGPIFTYDLWRFEIK